MSPREDAPISSKPQQFCMFLLKQEKKKGEHLVQWLDATGMPALQARELGLSPGSSTSASFSPPHMGESSSTLAQLLPSSHGECSSTSAQLLPSSHGGALGCVGLLSAGSMWTVYE